MTAKFRGAQAVVTALEDEDVPFAFGIPGAQNLELYDALAGSAKTRPVLVTDEQCASFMADGAWRASGQLCCVNLVPGAGLTHALSGIAEAYMDGIPMLIIACGVRSDSHKAFQLHDIDQLGLARPITTAQLRVTEGAKLYQTVRAACHAARTPPVGPVIVEIPANLLIFRQEASTEGWAKPPPANPQPPQVTLDRAFALLGASRRPLLYLGLGSSGAGESLVALAERLEAAVATTIQGKGVFPESHPLRLWCGFGPMAPPFIRSIVDDCDLTLAIGCRFAEVATGSYGLDPPRPLIHVDIDGNVLDRNYSADLAIQADAAGFVAALLERLPQRKKDAGVREQIKAGHVALQAAWSRPGEAQSVSPPILFHELQEVFGERTAFVVDSGNGLFEAMECLRLNYPRSFLAPVDFSCMGYSVPAAIGAALAAPDRPVVAIVGDGALLMTGLELLTACFLGVPVVVVVLRDRQLAQIAQFQEKGLARRTASDLSDFDLGMMCRAIGLEHLQLTRDGEARAVLQEASKIHLNKRPVVVEALMDSTYRTFFTRGVVRTNFGRLPWGERLRFVARVLERRLPGVG
jgi:acetolactate synthase-1/2/3 large subunit